MMRIIITLLLALNFSFATLPIESDSTDPLTKAFRNIQLDDTFMDHDIFESIKKRESFSQQRFVDIYGNGAILIPTIRDIFERDGVPDLFAYMPVIESGFTAKVRSRAGAVGIWQLVPATAKNFGLKVSKKVDERKDPVKSTQAVSRYVRAMHAKFGKWYLVVMAYSCGEGTLQRAIERAKSDRAEVLLDPNKKYLSAETRTHFKRLLTVYAMSHADNVSQALQAKMDKTERYKITTVWVKKVYALTTVASKLGMDPHELARLNAHVGKQAKKEKNGFFSLNIPETKVDLFYSAIDSRS